MSDDTTSQAPIGAWAEAQRVERWDDGKSMHEAGNALAAEVERLRGMVRLLHGETVDLRGLVERARSRINPDDPESALWADWTADADRILAADTGEDAE